MKKKNINIMVAAAVLIGILTAAIIALGATKDIPTPETGYPPRNESMTTTWDKAGSGYYDPDTYKPPSVPAADGKDDCLSCHAKTTPNIVADFQRGKMSAAGLTCASCHGKHPDLKMPNHELCGQCHADQHTGFMAGKHGRYGWKGHEAAGRRLAQYDEMQELGCGTCHNVGKKCDSCHTRHRFDPQEALDPAACGTCHMGPDHGQREYYESSKHGVIYSLDKKSYEQGGRAPVCATCHMSKGNHNVSEGITIGGSSQGKWIGDKNAGDGYVKDPNGIAMNEITADDFNRERAKMIEVCAQCHSRRYAEHKLASSDGVKIASDAVAGDALKVVLGLYSDGLLNPMPKDRPANPFAGATGNQADLGIWLTGHQLYEQTSEIEAMFFRTYKFDLIHAWKGAYHFAPDWLHWYGNAPLKLHLSEIIGQADTLRRLHALEQKDGIAPAPPKVPAAGQ